MKHAQGFLKLAEEARSRIREVSADEVRAMQDARNSFVLIDVREDHEWARGHIKGAVHLGRGIIERDVESLYPDKQAGIVLYCGGGYRSALAADSLQKMGYVGVSSMDGGWRAWNGKGYPVE
jgi:rhodanese-related sulfurtransferase